MPRRNQNLTKSESAILRQIALDHGYRAISGPAVKDGAEAGSALLFLLAIISGEVATVLLDTDQRWYAIDKLEASRDEVLIELAANLRAAAEREQARGNDRREAGRPASDAQ